VREQQGQARRGEKPTHGVGQLSSRARQPHRNRRRAASEAVLRTRPESFRSLASLAAKLEPERHLLRGSCRCARPCPCFSCFSQCFSVCQARTKCAKPQCRSKSDSSPTWIKPKRWHRLFTPGRASSRPRGGSRTPTSTPRRHRTRRPSASSLCLVCSLRPSAS
jgi:hypothetical protein